MKNEKIIIKASQQALAEALGFDEGRAYYLLLTKQGEQLDQEFSYSKKYRLMKSLFEAGAAGKFKPKDKDSLTYFLLPPSFLSFKGADEEIVSYLEKIYLDSQSEILKSGISQIMLKDEKPILVFLLKYFMKENAKVNADDLNMKKILGSKSARIDLTSKNGENQRSGIIDKKISYEFVKIPAKNEREYIGYISGIQDEEVIMH